MKCGELLRCAPLHILEIFRIARCSVSVVQLRCSSERRVRSPGAGILDCPRGKKFQKQDVQEDSDGEGYSLLFPGADGKVGRMVVVRRTETGMSITAVDIGLKKKAEEEQLAIDSDDAL